MGRRVRGLDFGLVVAAAYSGFVVWASGLSSSIALVSATHGAALNFIEQQTGRVAPLSTTLFAPANLVPCGLLLVVLPLLFSRLRPPHIRSAPPMATQEETETSAIDPAADSAASGPARWLERTPWLLLPLFAAAALHLLHRMRGSGPGLDVNLVIFVFLIAGMILHRRPIAYVRAWSKAATTAGPILLQYPLYGGILGLLGGSALCERLSTWAVRASTPRTFPLLTFLSSNVVSFFVPSGGGHWAVQGPIMLPAALKLGVSPPVTAMAVALGEQTANMVQPFWALPILAIAGLGIQDIMGYCALTFLVSVVTFGGALLLFG
jgi:short-chain fatty acids transporter